MIKFIIQFNVHDLPIYPVYRFTLLMYCSQILYIVDVHMKLQRWCAGLFILNSSDDANVMLIRLSLDAPQNM